MRSVSVAELKTSVDQCLDAVRKGEEVVITDRGRSLARMVSADESDDADGHTADLARQGILVPRGGPMGRQEPPPGNGSSGVLSALLEERTDGR